MKGTTLNTTEAAATFLFAGKAIFTLLSLATQSRFTFRVNAVERIGDGAQIWKVGVLTGSNNVSDYTWIGFILPDGRWVHSGASPIGPEAPSAKAFAWFYRFVVADRPLPGSLQVWTEGRCGRCTQKLTTKWAKWGYGGDCTEHLGLTGIAEAFFAAEAAQETQAAA